MQHVPPLDVMRVRLDDGYPSGGHGDRNVMPFYCRTSGVDDKIHAGENRVTFVGIFFPGAELSKVIGAEN